MGGFIRRCVGVVLVFLGVIALIFIVLWIIPGNPAAVLLNDHVNKETIERLTATMGLDRPLHEQFFGYLAGVLRGDLGQSYYMKKSVSSLVLTAFPYTLKLTVLAAFFAWLLGISIGVISAIHHDRLPDYLFRGVSLLGVSLPVFMVALFLQYLFYFKFSLLPLMYDGSIASMILPAIALGWNSAGSVARLTRSNLMEQFDQPYLDTARAKGLTSRQAVLRHGLKNAMLPIITMMALQLSGMLSGAVITESVFGIAGLGKLALTAVQTRDMPLLQGTVLFSALVISLGNIIADLINVCLDPRMRV
ncbi:ABC transporter permease [Butyrivibrio sp. FC2001]|uniref:ABC transporter permease n=1 Tax=Butyrivibrio sp. FC2001 TaxID=1280671 RepID=UPI000412FF70|nr:ABC transporter permease [Butyrivibrio sp. FC2001]